MREEEEDPFRPTPKLREEHQVFGAGGSFAEQAARVRRLRCVEVLPFESSFLVSNLAVDEGQEHPVGRAAEDHGGGWLLPGEERRPGERDDGQVGALPGGERARLVVEPERAR